MRTAHADRTANMEELRMKKVLIGSILAAAVAFGVSAAEPIGIDVGVDVTIDGFESDADLGVSLKPSVAYKRSISGIDAKATLSYSFPVYEEVDDGVIGTKLYGSKAFALSDTFTLTPGLTVHYTYNTALDEDQSGFGIEPEATLAYGNFYTLLTVPYFFVPDTAVDIYLEEGASFGAVSPYVYGDYAFEPDAKLASIGLGATYAWNAWTFGFDSSWSGFGDDEDVAFTQVLKVKYSF
jgi:hypothetical protein